MNSLNDYMVLPYTIEVIPADGAWFVQDRKNCELCEKVKLMSAEENKAIVRRFYEEVVNNGDFAAVDELLTEDFYDHSGSGSNQGRPAFKQFATMLTSAFPDLHLTVEDMIAEQDKVVARVTVRGTHKGTLFGKFPPTEQTITFTGVDIIRIEDGKIAERWNHRDILGLLQQLGVISTN